MPTMHRDPGVRRRWPHPRPPHPQRGGGDRVRPREARGKNPAELPDEPGIGGIREQPRGVDDPRLRPARTQHHERQHHGAPPGPAEARRGDPPRLLGNRAALRGEGARRRIPRGEIPTFGDPGRRLGRGGAPRDRLRLPALREKGIPTKSGFDGASLGATAAMRASTRPTMPPRGPSAGARGAIELRAIDSHIYAHVARRRSPSRGGASTGSGCIRGGRRRRQIAPTVSRATVRRGTVRREPASRPRRHARPKRRRRRSTDPNDPRSPKPIPT